MSLDPGPSLADLYAALAALQTETRRAADRITITFMAVIAVVAVLGCCAVGALTVREERRIARNVQSLGHVAAGLRDTARMVRLLQDEHDLGERRYGVLLSKLQLIGAQIALGERRPR